MKKIIVNIAAVIGAIWLGWFLVRIIELAYVFYGCYTQGGC